MTSSRSTKRALLTSALAILMCVAMLIGSTFAWFTDTASTGVNKIQAGKLDIELAYKNSTTGGEFKEANKETPVFDNNALWEPGHVEYVVLRVSNAGSLALKYKLGINIANEVGSTNVYNKAFKLSDYIRFAVLDGDRIGNGVDRDALVVAATDSKLIKEGYSKENHLMATGTDNSQKVVTLVVWMPTTVGNEANHKMDEAAPTIDLGISVAATQYNYESDSFGPDYDKFADYPEVQPVATADKLQEALASEDIDGKTIKLYDDIETEGLRLTGKNVAFDLNGKRLNTTKLEVNNSTVVFGDSSENGEGTLATDDSYGVINAVKSNVTIQNGRFVSSYKAGSSGYANVIQVRNSELTINGGYFENTNDVGSYNYLIKAPSYNRTEKTTITINGGEFVSHRSYGYIVTGDGDANVDVVINGGTFTTEGNNSYLTNVKGNVVVNDCTFTAGNSVVFNIPKGYTATVKGGTFSVNNKSGFFNHDKTTGWVSDFTGTLLVDPIKPVKINQETYSGFFANGATQSAKGADGFYTISK